MRKLLVVHENTDVIKDIEKNFNKRDYKIIQIYNFDELEKKIETEDPDFILLDINKMIDTDKNKAFKLLEKSLDKNVAESYNRLIERINDLPEPKGVNFEKETLLIIDEIENGEIVRIGKINTEILNFVRKDSSNLDKNAKIFIEKIENTIENESDIDVRKIKGFAYIPITNKYKTLDGIEIKTEYDKRKISEQETNNINEFTKETLNIIKNSPIHKPKDLSQFEDSYEELQILLGEIEYMKSEFITFVSHEIGTPLSIIKGNVELLVEGAFGKLNDKQKKRLNTIQLNIDRLTKIIRDSMELMKIESDKLNLDKESFSITDLANEIVSELQIISEIKNHKLNIEVDKKIPDIVADKNRIRQVFNNLINNAIKYTPKKGKIDVKILKDKKIVHVIIKDNGIGIPNDEKKKIFAKFYKVSDHLEDASGTGLGLAICKGIIDAHNGEIWVDSEINNGAAFHFTIPIEVS